MSIRYYKHPNHNLRTSTNNTALQVFLAIIGAEQVDYKTHFSYWESDVIKKECSFFVNERDHTAVQTNSPGIIHVLHETEEWKEVQWLISFRAIVWHEMTHDEDAHNFDLYSQVGAVLYALDNNLEIPENVTEQAKRKAFEYRNKEAREEEE
ncbi:MAG: hypothetical protein GF364_05015 [Candidatus Lokiarchaeota archaeon]|nr:hypothetical protein [Candidatus Lokiarchaeota archaeon]